MLEDEVHFNNLKDVEYLKAETEKWISIEEGQLKLYEKATVDMGFVHVTSASVSSIWGIVLGPLQERSDKRVRPCAKASG